ncbi:MAG: alpha/beta hydrolase [Paludibacter sp.]|nr:alpha/beta hydrolase [Paludibacter sp.]
MTNYFIVPGLGGSGTDHWQTQFEKTQPNFKRIHQKDWDHPDIDEWAGNVEKAIAGYDPETVVLVAHSLGCLTVVEWAKNYQGKIKAAMLVAPPDVELVQRKINQKLFVTSPDSKVLFPTILVASSNDPWTTLEKSKNYAENWGSKFINIGEAGHINNLSGFGEWNEGLEILKTLG